MKPSTLMVLDDEILHVVDADFLRTIVPGLPVLEDYQSPLEPAIELGKLDEALQPFTRASLGPEHDGGMSVAIRNALPLTAAQATRQDIWWWLCAARYPEIVRSRWAGADGSITADRMLGRKLHRNAFARLWWGAEMTRHTHDPDAYAKKLFTNQDVFEALIGRNLGNYPEATRVILDRLTGVAGKQARLSIKCFRHVLSTLVLEAMNEEQISEEVEGCLALVRQGSVAYAN